MGKASEYWRTAVEECLSDQGVKLPDDVIEWLACDMKLAAEMEGEASGRSCIPNPENSRVRELEAQLQRERSEHERELAAVKGLALRARGLREDSAFVSTRNGEAHFERR